MLLEKPFMDESYLLNPTQVIEFIQSNTSLFSTEADLELTDISGNFQSVEGYINTIYRIRDSRSQNSVIFKQFRLYLKGTENPNPDKQLSLARLKIEIAAFKLWDAICPGSVPKVFTWDEQRAFLIMADLSQMKLARFEFARRKKFPYFARQVGEFLGRTAFYTSDLFLDSIDKKNLIKGFLNPEQRELMERLIFDRFFFYSEEEPINPEVRADMQAFLTDEKILLEILQLKEIYMDRSQSLIHNDFHTANIFVDSETMKVIDSEAAFIGATAYDLGELFGNLILSCMSLQTMDDVSLGEKVDYEDYLLKTMEDIYHEFVRSFSQAWDQDARPQYRKRSAFRDDYLIRILQEAAGYAGCLAFSRLYDLGMSYDFSRIKNLHRRAEGQRLVIQTARRLILERERFEKIEEITALLKQIKTDYKISVMIREKIINWITYDSIAR